MAFVVFHRRMAPRKGGAAVKIAVVSDLHANLDAFRTMLSDAGRLGVDEIACLGDVVGYGPLPAETLDAVRRHCSVVIAGNHDDAVSGRFDASTFIDVAREAALRHRAALSKDALDYLGSLPYVCRFGEAAGAHGDFTAPREFRYVDGESAAEANFAATDAPLLFVGHTHIPCIFHVGASGTVHRDKPQDFVLETGVRYIVNPGSLGYPREEGGRCVSTYVVYDTAARSVFFRELPFRIGSILQRGTGGAVSGAGAPDDGKGGGVRWKANGRARVSRYALAAVALAGAALAASVAVNLRETASLERDEDRLPSAARGIMAGEAPPGAGEEVFPPVETKRGPADRYVNPGLKLRRGSAPAMLYIEYLDPTGAVVWTEMKRPRKSATSRSIPREAARAASARFSIYSMPGGSRPDIEAFDPRFTLDKEKE